MSQKKPPLHDASVDEVGDTRATATVLPLTSVNKGRIDSPTDVDVFQYNYRANVFYTILFTTLDGAVLKLVTSDVTSTWQDSTYVVGTPEQGKALSAGTGVTAHAGQLYLTISARDGVVGNYELRVVEQESVPPLAPSLSVSGGAHPVFSGTTEAWSKVNFIVDGVYVGSSETDASGTFSYTPAASFVGNNHSVYAVAIDLSSNFSAKTPVYTFHGAPLVPATLTPPTLVCSWGQATLTNQAFASLSGKAPAGSIIHVYYNNDRLVTGTTADGDGNWQATTVKLPDGPAHLTATAGYAGQGESAPSNAIDVVIDATPPNSPVVTFQPLEQQKVQISGTAEAGARVQLTIDGKAPITLTAGADGKFSYAHATELAKDYHYALFASDLAGNISQAANYTYQAADRDDYGVTAANAGSLTVGSSAKGELEKANDADWFKVSLDALGSYRFMLSGANNGAGTLAWDVNARDVHLRLWDPVGQAYVWLQNYESGRGDPISNFKVLRSGEYYVEVTGGRELGTYSLSGTLTDMDDYYGDRAHATSVALNSAIKGRLTSDDTDAFRIATTYGKTYSVVLTAGSDMVNGMPSMEWNDVTGTSRAYSSSGTNPKEAVLNFTARGNGDALLSISASSYSIGTYSLRVSEVVDDFLAAPGTSASLAVGASLDGHTEVKGDLDWVAINLDANQAYQFRVDAGAGSPFLRLFDASGQYIYVNPSNLSGVSTMSWTPSVSGRYFLEVSNSDAASSYKLSAQLAPTDDFGQSAGTAGELAAGATVAGRIETPNDADWFKLSLKAGNGYVLHVTPDPDMKLGYNGMAASLHDANGSWLNTAEGRRYADGSYDLILQPTADVTQYVGIGSMGSGLLGGYHISLDMPVADALAAGANTSGVLAAGGTLRSAIDFGADRDWIKVELEAGHTYRFLVQGAARGQGTLTQANLYLYDAGGNYLGFANNSGANEPELYYQASQTRTAYIAVSASNYVTGSYFLKMSSNTVPYADTDAPVAWAPSLPTIAPALGTPLSRDLILHFNENVKLAGEIMVVDANGAVVERFHNGDAGVSGSYTDLRLHLSQDLREGVSYHVQAAAGAVVDLAGNAAKAFDFSFLTPESGRSQVGGVGDDVFTSGTGSDQFTGGAGRDTVLYKENAANYYVNHKGTTVWVRQSGGSQASDVLEGVERLVFADKAIAYDTDGAAGQVYRLYQAAFNRQPDAAGLGFWIAQRDRGISMDDIARNFVQSAEFSALYGKSVSHTDFMTTMYANVMHRTPDAAGLAYWVQAMDKGISSEYVLAQFSESGENQANVIAQIQNGIHYQYFVA